MEKSTGKTMSTTPWLDDGRMVDSKDAPCFPIHVRVLGVPRFKRITAMKRQLDREKIVGYQIVEGIDADKEPALLRRAMKEHGLVVGPLVPMTPRSVACLIGHLILIPASLPADAQTVLILEDDAILVRGFRKRVECLLRQLPAEWDILQLGCNSVQGHPHGGCGAMRPELCSSCYCTGAYGYVAKTSFMRACLERERGRLSCVDDVFPCAWAAVAFNDVQLASFVPGARAFCARADKMAVTCDWMTEFTTEGDDHLPHIVDPGSASLHGIIPSSNAYDVLVTQIVHSLDKYGVAHVRAVFPPGKVGIAIEAAMATRPTAGEDLMDGRYEFYMAELLERYNLPDMAPADLIRRVCAEFSGKREVSTRASVVTAYPGAATQSFHRDRSPHSPLPRLLYVFASPSQVPAKTGATTTFIRRSNVEVDIDRGAKENHWRVYLDDGDLVIFFAHTIHRGDANRTTLDRNLLVSTIDVEDLREEKSIS